MGFKLVVSHRCGHVLKVAVSLSKFEPEVFVYIGDSTTQLYGDCYKLQTIIRIPINQPV